MRRCPRLKRQGKIASLPVYWSTRPGACSCGIPLATAQRPAPDISDPGRHAADQALGVVSTVVCGYNDIILIS